MIQLGVNPRPGLSALERLIILFDHALVTPGYGSGDSAIEYEDHVRKARAEAAKGEACLASARERSYPGGHTKVEWDAIAAESMRRAD